jgi:hypothetical protein
VVDEAGHDGNELVIWHRQPKQALVDALNEMPVETFPDGRWTGSLDAFREDLFHLAGFTSKPASARLSVLCDDLLEIAGSFARRWPSEAYTFRCHPLTDTMCPRFHCDRGAARLLCTYLGPGTEWAPNEAINRQAMATHGAWNDAIVTDWQQVQSVPRFAVAILLGQTDGDSRGVVHRSPEVPDGTQRFTFCMTLPSTVNRLSL